MSVAVRHAEVLLNIQTDLGECPLWDHRTEELVFVDINAGELYRVGADDDVRVIGVGTGLGAVGIWGADDFIAGTDSGFARIDRAGYVTPLVELDLDDGLRLNDCQVAPDGAFWGGTMEWVVSRDAGSGCLFRLAPDGTVVRALGGVKISNGLAWSPDGGTMYYIDSATRAVDLLELDAEYHVAQRRRHVVLEDGVPDGMCVDASGALWVAAWGAGEVVQYSPEGRVIQRITVPASMPTSCCLGGREGRTLYITSGSSGLAPGSRHREHAGAVFAIEVDTPGLPARSYGG